MVRAPVNILLAFKKVFVKVPFTCFSGTFALRKIRRWGVASKDALDSSCKGAECRGEEHEIVFVWSVTSGKRIVLMDGEKIHSSTGKRSESKFVWTCDDYGICIIAYAAPPIIPKSSWKQFDLLFSNKSFEALPHIFQLGHKPKIEESSSTVDSMTMDGSLKESYKELAEPSSTVNSGETDGSFEGDYKVKVVESIKITHNASLLSNRYEPSDKLLDEINPNEPPSLEDLSQKGNQDDSTTRNLSIDELWGKATDISTRQNSPKNIVDFESCNEVGKVKYSPLFFRRKLPSQRERYFDHKYIELFDA
jgi:hypothetical protein